MWLRIERHLSLFLRPVGLLIPIAFVVLLQLVLQPHGPEPRGASNLAIYASLLSVAALSGALLRSCSAVVVVPLEILIVGWITRWLFCAECSTAMYDAGVRGTFVFGLLFTIPIIVATFIGVALGTAAAR